MKSPFENKRDTGLYFTNEAMLYALPCSERSLSFRLCLCKLCLSRWSQLEEEQCFAGPGLMIGVEQALSSAGCVSHGMDLEAISL